MNNLTVIIPVYNEGNNILRIINQFRKEAKSIDYNLVFVDDNSTDARTKEILNNLSQIDNVTAIRNLGRGQHSAIMEGFRYASDTNSKYMGAIDCDMQDPVNIFVSMYKELIGFNDEFKDIYERDGIIGVRTKRKDTIFKKISANMYYLLLSLIAGEKQQNSSDFYIVKTDKLKDINEDYIRGSISRLDVIKYPYERKKRLYGKSKYTLIKMLKTGIKGIVWTSKNR